MRILGDRDAARLLDRREPRGPVVERSGQHDADRARPERSRGRSKQRIDRGPHAVLRRAVQEADAIVLERHVLVRRRHVDAAVEEAFPVSGMPRRQAPGPAEDVRQNAAAAGEMQHHQERGPQVRREARDDRADGFDPSRRRADDDDVVRGHVNFSAFPVPGTALAGTAKLSHVVCHGYVPAISKETREHSGLNWSQHRVASTTFPRRFAWLSPSEPSTSACNDRRMS